MGWGVINRGIVCREKIPQFVYSQLSFVSCSIKTYSSTLRLNRYLVDELPEVFAALEVDHELLVYTVKKGWRFFRPQPGCHLPNSP
jgi:hypothetical protein